MRRALGLVAFLFTADVAYAARTVSGLVFAGGSAQLNLQGGALMAQRPSFFQSGEDISGQVFALSSTTSIIDVGERMRDVGSQPGVRAYAKAGMHTREHWAQRPARPFADLGLELSLRTHAFNVPIHGMVVLHTGGELGFGAIYWWSTWWRIRPTIGVRLATRMGELIRAEIDYTLVPHVMTASPGGLDVDRLEQRGEIRLAFKQWAIGVDAILSFERTRQGQSIERTRSQMLLGVLEFRPE